MADKYQTLINGRERMIEATVVSTGSAQAGNIVALDLSGKLDVSLLPTGVGPLVVVVEASEALSAGRFVNIHNVSGSDRVRLADATNDRPAHGFVRAAYAVGELATVYLRQNINEHLTGLLPGQRLYLGAAGQVITSPPTLPTYVIHQFLGIAQNATTAIIDIEDEIVL